MRREKEREGGMREGERGNKKEERGMEGKREREGRREEEGAEREGKGDKGVTLNAPCIQ